MLIATMAGPFASDVVIDVGMTPTIVDTDGRGMVANELSVAGLQKWQNGA